MPGVPESATQGSDPRAAALSLLKRFGWNATSFQTLEEGFDYWFAADAVVAYVDTGSAWVAAGPPVAPEETLGSVAVEFCAAARAQGKRACFFGPEQRFIDRWPGGSLIIGEQPVWDAREWPGIVQRRSSLREQLRRARAKGLHVRQLTVDEVAGATHPTRQRLDHLIRRWLATREMAPMTFVVRLEPFSFPAERRYFAAEHEGDIVGFLALVPIYGRQGWFLDDLVRDPHAPNGTAESLVDAAMNALANEGCHYATLGLAPLAGAAEVPLLPVLRASRSLYNFSGLRAFKNKLEPSQWDPIYVAYEGSATLALLDILRAFASGGLLRFGLSTLMRGPSIAVRLLALLLVPWTVLLAIAPVSYFPSRSVQGGWIGFDIVIALAMLSLTRRYRPWLATVLAFLVTCDFAVTTVEVSLFNLPHLHSAPEALASAAAIVGPLLAALLLWFARLHRRAASRLQPTY